MLKSSKVRNSGNLTETLSSVIRPVEEVLSRLKSLFQIDEGRGSDAKLAAALGTVQQTLVSWRARGIPWKTLAAKLPADKFQELYQWANATTERAGIPLVAYAGAGTMEVDTPMSYEDQQELVITPLKLPRSTVALCIKGSSMEPEYFDGDIVLVVPVEHPKRGAPYVFVGPGGETWLKSLFHTGDRYELRSLNKAPAIVLEHPPRAFDILWHIRKVPKAVH